jgi:glyoxylase-like metal-dependent hydrolase (beta-lactamase superfamily II)
MKVHYLNCGTMYPRGAPLFVPYAERSCCLCLLLETESQLVLVDTGFGTMDMENPNRLRRYYNFVMNIQTDPEEPAVRQVEKMGFDPGDVRDIICTHLDPDHSGGLADFPQANVHVSEIELDALSNPRNHMEKTRVCRIHFSHGPKWVTHGTISEEPWFGIDCMRDLPEFPPQIVLVPLPGHTRGQLGVAVDTGNGWLLHCGDAYYVKEELREIGKAPIGTRAFRRFAHCDHAQAMKTIAELKGVLREHGSEITTISSHDQFEYRNIFGRPFD